MAVRRRALRLLIASGPTREPIDAVRFLSNYSTGLLGALLADEALRRGHAVRMVSGPAQVQPPAAIRVDWVERTDEMDRMLRRRAPQADVIIMAAAVCDYRPAAMIRRKVPRRGVWTIRLVATPDLIARLPRRAGQLVVGFALESDDALRRAQHKLTLKRLDVIVGQRMEASGGPFGARPVNAFLLTASGERTQLGRTPKRRLACAILDKIERLWYGAVPARRAARRPSIAPRRLGMACA